MDELSRRAVLRRGAIASGALVLGSSALTGSVGAAGGGSGFFSEGAVGGLGDEPFELLTPIDWTLEHSPGCSGNPNAKAKVYGGWRVMTAGGQVRHFYAHSANHELGDWKQIVSATPCPPDAVATRPNGTQFDVPVMKVGLKAVDAP